MHAYSVYGLSLQSEFPIPELLSDTSAATDVRADVVVRYGKVAADWFSESPHPQAVAGLPDVGTPSVAHGHGSSVERTETEPDADDSWAERRAANNETLCVFSGVGRYLIAGGRTIEVEPEAGVDDSMVRHLLLGPVLAHLLWQRDIFTLHASVVDIAGLYAGFVGVSGEGKSTTAAALEAHGHALVCDDIAALTEQAGRLHVLPAFPRIRLYADSVESVGDDPTRHPWVHPHIDKRSKSIARFVSHPVPLHRLYVLATGDTLSIERIPTGAALIELLRHTYYAHQYAPLYGFKHQLEQAARVVKEVPVYRLTRPKDLARLPELVGLLEASGAP